MQYFNKNFQKCNKKKIKNLYHNNNSNFKLQKLMAQRKTTQIKRTNSTKRKKK